MADPLPATPESRVIRVFLSSTFRDFMQERDLLVKQVFPALRRRAQKRGVEIVDVDLRWGITEEESQQGKVIGICLAEIERCRPYFIGMLGERYGWTPAPDTYPDELFEREQLRWLRDHQGGASVTELEILHGVLNDREMAGRAFFYFRDPAWSRAQSEPGFVCDTAEEEAKLADLKQRILNSGFPVKQNLADPQAIADQTEADLWELIEELYPDVDTADALEREERKHASYRQSRLGVYLGEEYVRQLEGLIQEDEKKVLITGESGCGKSALIANWMATHHASHPEDVVLAHHLGCSNDANAISPLLARMLGTASRLLVEHELISEPIKVPQDCWELTAKMAETLQDLGRWCKTTGHRWIWVLDGLDRLDAEDQQALPWLPLLIPDGVSVVFSALDCPARQILLERQFHTLQIGSLQRPEQQALIDQYLQRYTKKLTSERREQILACEQARSPLFLKVLLEELRQCGRYETLKEQIEGYIRPNADGGLGVNDLYERVLERLENDFGREEVRKVMTALWASRAGLSESELLGITKLTPLQWSPIGLTLANAFGRNGNRLAFDHDYLRNAVRDLHLPTNAQQQQAHSVLADWYKEQQGWDGRKAEELPWQLQQAAEWQELRLLLLNVNDLFALASELDNREVVNYWLVVKGEGEGELDELIVKAMDQEIEKRKNVSEDQIRLVDCIAALLGEVGLHRELLLKLRVLQQQLEEVSESRDEESKLTSMGKLADAHINMGHYDDAELLYLRCLEARIRLLGDEHPSTLITIGSLANLFLEKGDYIQAEDFYIRTLDKCKRLLGDAHPFTLTTVSNLGLLLKKKGDYEQADFFLTRCLEDQKRLLGPKHPSTLNTLNHLGGLYNAKGDYEQAEVYHNRCLEARERVLGPEHPDTLITVNDLAILYRDKCNYEKAEACFTRTLTARERLLGATHPNTFITVNNLAVLFEDKGDYEQAETFYTRCLEGQERLLGHEHPDTLVTVNNLGNLYQNKGDYNQAEFYYTRCLVAWERVLGFEHPHTLITVNNLGWLFQNKGDYEQAEFYYARCLDAWERILGPEHPDTLTTLNNLGGLFRAKGVYVQAEAYYKRCLEARVRLLGPEHPDTLTTLGNLGLLCSDKGDYQQAEFYCTRCLEARERLLGPEHPATLATINNLGNLYQKKGDYEQSEEYLNRCLEASERLLGPESLATLYTVNNLGNLYRDKGDYEQAEAYYARCLQARKRLLGPEHPNTLTIINNLADLYCRKGDYEQAEAYYTCCLEARERLLGPQHPDTLVIVCNLADLLSQQGRPAEAIPLRRRELAWSRQQNGDTDPGTLASINALAMDLLATGALEEAEALFRELVEARQQVLEPSDFSIGEALSGLAQTLELAGKLDEAAVFAQQAIDHRLAHEGPDSCWTSRKRLDLARIVYKLGRSADATQLLDALQASITSNAEPDDDDRQLLADASVLRDQIKASP